jgi:hypothetical protein
MNGFWAMIGQHLAANAEAYGVGAIAIAVAAGKCMPKPGSSLSFLTIYTWLYDTIQAVLPIPRTSVSSNTGTLNGVPIPPTPPVDPATTK